MTFNNLHVGVDGSGISLLTPKSDVGRYRSIYARDKKTKTGYEWNYYMLCNVTLFRPKDWLSSDFCIPSYSFLWTRNIN